MPAHLSLTPVAIAFCAALAHAAPAAAQVVPTREPPPEGRRLLAGDGDVIVVTGEDRVRVVRRREAAVRVIADEAHRFVVILADWSTGPSPSDGQVDQAWRFSAIEGRWPFEARWEGTATIEEQDGAFGGPPRTFALETLQGTIWFTGAGPQARAASPDVVAVIRYMSGGSGVSRGSFDEAEQREVLTARDPATALAMSAGRTGAQVGSASVTITAAPPDGAGSIADGAVRAGAGVPAPVRIRDVAPRMPDEARQAGVRGVVILEIRIEPDGSVSAVRVLRSIPMLDDSAVRAVRQWQFAPTRINGQPVAVVMTATVDFR